MVAQCGNRGDALFVFGHVFFFFAFTAVLFLTCNDHMRCNVMARQAIKYANRTKTFDKTKQWNLVSSALAKNEYPLTSVNKLCARLQAVLNIR